MTNSSITVTLVLGGAVVVALLGLGFGLEVWRYRRRRSRSAAGAGEAPSPARLTVCLWLCAGIASAFAVRGLVDLEPVEGRGILAGEGLHSVYARSGLKAVGVTMEREVRGGDAIARFAYEDGEDQTLSLRTHRVILEEELEVEGARPLEIDPALVAVRDEAERLVRELGMREDQLREVRDAILRELTRQKLDYESLLHRIEQEASQAAREAEQARVDLATARTDLLAAEALLGKGLVAKYDHEVAAARVTGFESQVRELEDQGRLLDAEKSGITQIYGEAEAEFQRQLSKKEDELAEVGVHLESAGAGLAAAQGKVDRDAERAGAQRDARLRQIRAQIAEREENLASPDRLVARAPFDGRVGFREPSPASRAGSRSPLVVLYPPGGIWVEVRLPAAAAPADAAEAAAKQTEVELTFERPEAEGADEVRPGRIVATEAASDGLATFRIACDPPALAVRNLALGETVVAVKTRVGRPLLRIEAFRWAAGFGAAAVSLALLRSFLRRRRRQPESAVAPAPRPAPAPVLAPALATATPALRAGAFSPPASAPAPAVPVPAPAPPAILSLGGGDDGTNPSELRRLAARLRLDIERGAVDPEIVRSIDRNVRAGKTAVVAPLIMGFGTGELDGNIVDAACNLLSRRTEVAALEGRGAGEQLGSAVEQCASLIRVLRTIGPRSIYPLLDQLQDTLVATARREAQSSGCTPEEADGAVRPLRLL